MSNKIYKISRKLNEALVLMALSRTNREGNSQMLWNDRWDEITKLIVTSKDELEQLSKRTQINKVDKINQRNSYTEKINRYVSLVDRQRLKNAIVFVENQKCDTTVNYRQEIKSKEFTGDVEIHISLRNKTWEHNVFYNRHYFLEFSQALLVVRDKIHLELGWIKKSDLLE